MSDTDEVDQYADLPGVICELGEFGPGAVITEQGLGHMFNRCQRSIQRAVERGELPQPTRLLGKRTWTAGAIVQHIEGRLQDEAKERQRLERKIQQLSP